MLIESSGLGCLYLHAVSSILLMLCFEKATHAMYLIAKRAKSCLYGALWPESQS